MKRVTTWIILILFFVDLNAQNQTNGIDISNKLTKKHIRVPGTRVSIVPAKNFELSENFSGFSNGNAVITIWDIFDKNFDNQTKTLSRKDSENSGLIVLEFKEFKINNLSAKYLHTSTADSSDISIILAFGDSSFMVLLVAAIPGNSKKNIKDIKKSLLSVYFDKELILNPFENAGFELDLTNSEYQFEKSGSGIYFFKSNATVGQPEENPFFIVTQIPSPNTSEESLKYWTVSMIEKIKKQGIDSLIIYDSKNLTIDGRQAIETKCNGQIKTKKVLYYLLVTGKPEKVLVINSIIKINHEENLKKLVDAVYTLKFKLH